MSNFSLSIKLTFPIDVILEEDYSIMKPIMIESKFCKLSNEYSEDELIEGVLIQSSASVEHEDVFAYLPAILQFYLERVRKRFVRCNPNSGNTKIQKEIGINML